MYIFSNFYPGSKVNIVTDYYIFSNIDSHLKSYIPPPLSR